MNPIEFARNLFTLRMERRMTVETLAEALGVTPEIICEWECAKTSPSLDQMNRLAKVYGIPLDEIIRNPKPHKPVEIPPVPAEEPEVAPAPAEEAELPAEETMEEIPVEAPPKARRRWVDGIVIGLLLAIIAAATVFLIKPEWFPWLG